MYWQPWKYKPKLILTMKNKEIFSKLQKHKERIIRQIEYRRLKRVRRKKLPNIPIVRIVVPNWTACIVISAGNTPWISSSPSGNTSFSTSRMFISLIARYGLRYTIFLPVPASWHANSMLARSIRTYIHCVCSCSCRVCFSCFSLPWFPVRWIV